MWNKETGGSDGGVHYLDCDGGFTGVYICQNLSDCILLICAVTSIKLFQNYTISQFYFFSIIYNFELVGKLQKLLVGGHHIALPERSAATGLSSRPWTAFSSFGFHPFWHYKLPNHC